MAIKELLNDWYHFWPALVSSDCTFKETVNNFLQIASACFFKIKAYSIKQILVILNGDTTHLNSAPYCRDGIKVCSLVLLVVT